MAGESIQRVDEALRDDAGKVSRSGLKELIRS